MSLNWTHIRWKIIGLYEEDHGIINNKFYDPNYDEKFKYGRETKWFNATEPIWVTAEREGKKSGAYMWTGQSIYWQAKCSCSLLLVGTILPPWFIIFSKPRQFLSLLLTSITRQHLSLAKRFVPPPTYHWYFFKIVIDNKSNCTNTAAFAFKSMPKGFFFIMALWNKKRQILSHLFQSFVRVQNRGHMIATHG